MINRDTLLFFDASCLVAAAGSPSGGSAFLLSYCASGLLRAAVSQPVLLEAERNILRKLGPEVLHAYRRLVLLTPLSVVELPPAAEASWWTGLVNQKDEHVLIAAMEAQAQYLLTLDRGLAEQVNRANLALRALSPGEFIRIVLIHHEDYTAS